MVAVGICSNNCSLLPQNSSSALIPFATEIQVCKNYATSAAPAKITRQGFKRDQINQINLQYSCGVFAEES